MKKLLVIVFALVVNLASFAAEKPSPSLKSEIRSKIVKLLGKADFDVQGNSATDVELLVNKNGQIVVLDVKSKNSSIKNFITSKLNYKQVVGNTQQDITVYKMSVKIVNE